MLLISGQTGSIAWTGSALCLQSPESRTGEDAKGDPEPIGPGRRAVMADEETKAAARDELAESLADLFANISTMVKGELEVCLPSSFFDSFSRLFFSCCWTNAILYNSIKTTSFVRFFRIGIYCYSIIFFGNLVIQERYFLAICSIFFLIPRPWNSSDSIFFLELQSHCSSKNALSLNLFSFYGCSFLIASVSSTD